MDTRVSRSKLIALALAAGVIITIFVPLQRVNAFTVDVTLPNTSGNNLTQSTDGNDFQAVITVEPNEFLRVSSLNLIVDNQLLGVRNAVFDANGARTSGDTGLVKNNVVTITSSTTTAYGYGYGFGSISTGPTPSTPYSYAFTSSNGFIGGNTLGNSDPSATTNNVLGYVGPATITISGKLNTGTMSVGSHTLNIFINTGLGGNGEEQIVAPPLSFIVNANAQVVQATVTSGSNVSVPSVTVPGVGTVSVTISNVESGGTIAVQPKSAATLDAETPTIFSAVGAGTSIFNVGTSTANTVGTVFEVDISSITLGSGATIDVTIPYDPAALPAGFDEANVKFYHWNGSAWEDKTVLNGVNTVANTVTGRLTSLSPVVAGFAVSSTTTTTTTTTTSGGGGGGGGSSVFGGIVDLTPNTTTYSDGYFLTNPLAKVQVQNSAFVNVAGQNVFGASSGQQVTIATSFKNYQQDEQDYAIIIQIIDSNGFTTDLGWTAGKLEGGAIAQASRSWTTDESGSYTVKMFVWNGVSQAPTPLSEVTTKNFIVT